MGWRDKYKVHPAADVFPMMTEEELDATAADIKANGLREPITFWYGGEDAGERFLIDGRNRLEAAERAGYKLKAWDKGTRLGDPVAYIISKNIHRRHLTKQQQADLIVAALKAGEKPPQDEAVSKGGRGKVNPVKQAAIATGKEHGISKATVERSLAKAEGKKPKKKKEPPIPKHLIERRREIQAELERRGVDYCSVCIFDPKQSKAAGGSAEHTIGWHSELCQGVAAEKAFNEAVAAIMERKHKPEEEIEAVPGQVLPPCAEEPDIIEQALALVKKMTGPQRKRFYSLLHKRYPSLFVVATAEIERGVPMPPRGKPH